MKLHFNRGDLCAVLLILNASSLAAEPSLEHRTDEVEDVERILSDLEGSCESGWKNDTDWCPAFWDGVLCWPSTPPGKSSVQSCPWYIDYFDLQMSVSKQCMRDGSWDSEGDGTWTDYSSCRIEGSKKIATSPISQYLPMIKATSTLGHVISLSSNILAVYTLHYSKKLIGNRMYIQKNLFLSYILLNSATILNGVIFNDALSVSAILNGEVDCYRGTFFRKLIFSFWQYSVTVNRALIFATCWSLFMFAFYPRSYYHREFRTLVHAAWVYPAVVAVGKLLTFLYDDRPCGTLNYSDHIYVLLISIPINVSVVVNIGTFTYVVLKLRSPTCYSSFRNKKIVNDMLKMMPALGTHNCLISFLSLCNVKPDILQVIWLFCDQFFTSFQGFLVVLLHWILNLKLKKEAFNEKTARSNFRSILPVINRKKTTKKFLRGWLMKLMSRRITNNPSVVKLY